MRNTVLDLGLTMVVVVLAGLMFLAAGGLAEPQHQPKASREDSVKSFLRDYVGDPSSGDKKETRYSSAFVDLKEDGTQEVIVYLAGDGWCGSGGCTTLILAPTGSSYRVVTKIFTTRTPIRVLRTKSNGWHDIGVMVRVWYGGKGDVYAREEKQSFNGKSYRISARRSVEEIAGEVVIPATAEGTPLY